MQRPCLGTPFSKEFDNKKSSKIEHTIKDGILEVKAYYDSSDFAGISLIDNLKIYPDRTMERFYTIFNNGDTAQKLTIKDQYEYDWLAEQYLPYEDKILSEISHHLKEENISENWFYTQAKKGNTYVSFCWGKSSKPMFKDYGIFFNVDFGVLQPGESKDSEPITIAINRFFRFQDLRYYAAEKYNFPLKDSKQIEEFDNLELNGGNPFGSKLSAAIQNSSEHPLDGEFTLLYKSEELANFKVSKEEAISQKAFEIDFKIKYNLS
jgi:hypothetical protein